MNQIDWLLGLERQIKRRDFGASTVIGTGSLLLNGLTPLQLRANDERVRAGEQAAAPLG